MQKWQTVCDCSRNTSLFTVRMEAKWMAAENLISIFSNVTHAVLLKMFHEAVVHNENHFKKCYYNTIMFKIWSFGIPIDQLHGLWHRADQYLIHRHLSLLPILPSRLRLLLVALPATILTAVLSSPNLAICFVHLNIHLILRWTV